MIKGGNTSTTEIKDNIFIKYFPKTKYDERIGLFQTRLYYNINNFNSFAINKPISFVSNTIDNNFQVEYEFINEKEWSLDEKSITIIAENMAKIHNYCYDICKITNLPIKNSLYNSLYNWKILYKEGKVTKKDYLLRKNIFSDIPRINTEQVKIPLHRDFRKHNILWDGKKYFLIDFDYAAHDFLSLEIAGFISDILDDDNLEYSKLLLNLFCNTYFKYLKIKNLINFDIITDYINYLCVNTFPIYLKDKISKSNYNILLKERNDTLIKLYKNRDLLESIIEKSIKYE